MSVDAARAAGSPYWPASPEAVDRTGASYLVLAAGRDEDISAAAQSWVAAAEAVGPTHLVVVDSMADADDRRTIDEALATARTGVRIMIAGGQYDVMVILATARAAGALNHELTAFVTHTRDLPLYCAHCRDTHCVAGRPGAVVDCPGLCAAAGDPFPSLRGSGQLPDPHVNGCSTENLSTTGGH